MKFFIALSLLVSASFAQAQSTTLSNEEGKLVMEQVIANVESSKLSCTNEVNDTYPVSKLNFGALMRFDYTVSINSDQPVISYSDVIGQEIHFTTNEAETEVLKLHYKKTSTENKQVNVGTLTKPVLETRVVKKVVSEIICQ